MHKPNRSFAQKVFAAGLAVTTALWAFGGLFAVAGAVEAHPAGTLVLSGTTVWHVSDDGTMRHGIDSLAKFQSHRYSFSSVVPANSADLVLPDGGLMGWGSGVLFNDGGTVYQVSGGQKHGFTSASAFTGSGFSFASVVSASLAAVPAGSNISDAAMAHMEGTFVASGGTVWMITATGRKGVPSPGVLYSYGAKFSDVVSANSADLALANEGNATFRTGALVNDSGTLFAVTATSKRGFPSASCYTGFGFNFSMPVAGSAAGLTAGANYCAETTPPVTPPVTPPTSAGTLSVSLASDTPASGTIVNSAARVGFTKVNLTAGASDVIVDSMVVERVGISNDNNFTDVILLDVTGAASVGTAAQIGNEKTLGSTHQVTFGDDITVKAGTTKSLMLAANMDGSLNAGEQAALQLNSVTLAGTATLSGSLPVKGNTMTFNGTLSIGTTTIAAGASNPAATTQRVGVNDYIVSAIRVTAGAAEDIEIQQMRFYQNGTAADADVKDLELLVDGAVIGTVAKPANKEAIFKFASPIVIKKGENKEFNLRLDIMDGSSRTISLDFEKRTDVVSLGKTYGYFMTPTYPNSTAPFFNASNTEIGIGTLTFSKGTVASLNVAEGTNSQVIGSFKTTVEGEPIQVTQLVFDLNVTGGGNGADLTNIVVKNSSGSVVAGPFDGADNAHVDQATTTDTIIFPTGTNSFDVVANLNSDFSANDTIVVDVTDPDTKVTAKGTVTNQTVTANPTSDVALDTMTVKSGNLAASTQAIPAAQNVLVGQTGFTFANFVLSASASGEDVRVTQMAVVHKTAVNSTQTNIANLTMYDGTTALSPIVQPAAAAATTATSTFSFTNPIVVAKGSAKTITLKGDIVAGTANTDTHSFGCNGTACLTVVGASTSTSFNATVTNSDGQTMSIVASGTFTVAADGSEPSTGKLLTGGTSKATVGELLLAATNEDINLSYITFGVTGVNGGTLTDEIGMVYLFDGATQVDSVSPTSTTRVTFSNLEGKFTVPKGSNGKKLTVKVDTLAVTNLGGDGNVADSGDGVQFTVAQDAYGGKGVASGASISAANRSGTFTGQQYTVYKTLPTFERVSLSSSLADGDQGLFAFKLTADSKGDVGFYRAAFHVATTGVTVLSFKLYEEYGTVNQVDLTNDGARTATAGEFGTNGAKVDVMFDTGTDGTGNGGEFRFIGAGLSKTFTLRGTVSNASSGDTITATLRNGTAFSSAGGYPACAGGLAVNYQACGTGVAEDQHGNFIWSDLFYGNSSSTATNTAEWFNGFRVPGLSSTSTQQGLSKS